MGIVHRDIKPATLLVAAGDKVSWTTSVRPGGWDSRLTKSGVIGTQAYWPRMFRHR